MSQNNRDTKSNSNSQISISQIQARNKLKEVEDKIYEARHRLDILGKKQSKAEHQDMYRTKVQGFKGHIRDFASTHRQIKQEYKLRRSLQIQNSHDINMERRSEHREKLSEMQELIQTQNRWVYENIRRQKQANQSMVRKQRSKQQERRRRRRDQMFEDEKKRSAYLKEFLYNKHLTAKLSKQQETYSIQAKILQRQKLLANLQRQSSEMSMNPQSSYRQKSLEGNQSRLSKGFRISSRKK